MENEQKTIDLIKDVASLLERAAVGPLHTPALYATFLKALISAKFEGTNTVLNSPRMNMGTSINGMNLQINNQAISNTVEERNVGVKPNILGANAQMFNPMDFSAGEMGPVMDMSTFPPRMAPQTEEPPSQLLSMDSILSSDFWDSVLVPGYSNSLEGLSGGFVYGSGGNSMYIASRLGTPIASEMGSPMMGSRHELANSLTS